jgi:hypothetical protein
LLDGVGHFFLGLISTINAPIIYVTGFGYIIVGSLYKLALYLLSRRHNDEYSR